MVAPVFYVIVSAAIISKELAAAIDPNIDPNIPFGLSCEDIYNNKQQYRSKPGYFFIHDVPDRVFCGMSYAGSSCKAIYDRYPKTRSSSGFYLVESKWTYCNMTNIDHFPTCAGIHGNWKRIARLDVSAGDNCPSGWLKTSYGSVSYCRVPLENPQICSTTLFSTNGMSYQSVCGRVRGYQKGGPSGFAGSHRHMSSIDDSYLDGVSITRGNPREHIWSYAIGTSDSKDHPEWNCPCAFFPGKISPHFVGDHYYCESGNNGNWVPNSFYVNDVLWDGIGCNKSRCCGNIMQPWFHRSLSKPSTEDIEVRICAEREYAIAGTLVDFLELYVQ